MGETSTYKAALHSLRSRLVGGGQFLARVIVALSLIGAFEVVSPDLRRSMTGADAAPAYNLTYDSQGGSAVPAQSWTSGQSWTLPTPTRAGYTFNGWSTSSAGSTKVYETTSPTRSGNNIVYTSGYGKAGSDAAATLTAAGATFDKIRYRMEAKYNASATPYYADVTFDKWAGATISSLAVPDMGDQRLIKTNVTNLSVDSNWPGVDGVATAVTTGSSKSGRLELWARNYATSTSGVSPVGDGSIYDADDTQAVDGNYGSFQVHNLTDSQTVLAWNQHASLSPDIGFGSNLASIHTDWTFRNSTNFSSWKLQIFIGDLFAGGSTYAPTNNADSTLYAQWTANTLTVTYDSQGGSAVSSGSTVTDGSVSSSPGTPTRAGYTFNGWFAAASGGSAITFPWTHGKTADFTVYAQWTGNTNTVTYNTQGGSAVSSSSWVTGSSLSLPAAPTLTGYTFNGWYTAASGGSRVGGGGDSYSPANTSGFTLYAQWTIGSYTVTYDGNGSTGGSVPSPQTQNYNTTVTVQGNTGSLTRTGYAFNGWNTAADGTGTNYGLYSPGIDYSTYACGSGASPARPCNASVLTTGTATSIYTNWGSGNVLNSGLANNVEVKFTGFVMSATTVNATFQTGGDDGQYLTFNGSNIITNCWYDKGSGNCQSGQVTLTAGVYYPYTFWFYENGGGAAAYFSWNTGSGYVQVPSANLYRTAQSGSFTLTGDTTLYAQWAGGTNTVSYDSQGGSAVSSASWVTGSSLSLPAAPTRNGYTFNGWYDAASGGAKVGNASASYSPSNTGDFTLYAQWTANTLTVTYDSQGGSAIGNGSTVTGGSIASSPGTPTRSLHDFKGWYAASSGGSPITFPYTHGRTANFTLYAQWITDQAPLSVTGASATLAYLATVTLGTSGGSGTGGVTFATTTPAVCSVNAGTGLVTMLAPAGTCSIAATKAADADYYATAASINISATFASQATLTVSGSATGTYGGTVNLSTSGGTTGGSVTWSVGASTACSVNASGSVTITSGTGTCGVSATMAGDANYNPVTSAAHVITVSKASQSTLTVTSTEVTFGQSLNLTSSGGSGSGVVTWARVSGTCSVAAGVLTPGDAGSACVVRATKATDSNYSQKVSADTSVTVNRASQTGFSVTSASSFTTGSSVSLTASGGQSSGTVSWLLTSGSCTLSGSTLTAARGGISCTVEATKAGDTNYLSVSDSLEITVNKITQTLTFKSTPPTNAVVGSTYTVTVDSDAFLAPTVTIANTSTSVCSVSAGVVTFNATGTCLVSASQAGNDVYSSASASQSVTVNAAPPPSTAPAAVDPAATGSSVPTSAAGVPTAVTTTVAPGPGVKTVPTTTTSTTTTVPADPGQPQTGADGEYPSLPAGQATALVRGVPVKVKVEQVGSSLVVSLPNDVKIVFGSASAAGDSVGIGADGVLRMYRKDMVDVSITGLEPGTTYTVFMFSTPVELGRGETAADGSVKATVQIPAGIEFGEHTVQINGVGPGSEVVTTSLGFEVLERKSNTALTVSVLALAILLALLGGRPVYVGRRRRNRAV